MNVKHINCLFGADFVLVPCNSTAPNTTQAVITFDDSRPSGRTATVAWAGRIRAFLTFGPTGNQVISYTLTDDSVAAQQSVENIIPFI